MGLITCWGSPLTDKEMLTFAMEGERVACGSAHADNVAPGLLGGFVLVRSYQPLDVIKIPIALKLYCTILHSHIEIKTENARKMLKQEVSLKHHVAQSGNAAGLIAGLMMGDDVLIQRSLQDVIIEPQRSLLIPGFSQMKQAGLAAGALGVGISGSGPSLFALCLTQALAEKVGEAMFKACPGRSSLYISKVNDKGPLILS